MERGAIMEKLNFEIPMMEIVEFESEDVITASGPEPTPTPEPQPP